MIGTILNVITIIVGGALGILFGKWLPERIQQTVLAGMGLFTAVLGIQMFFKTTNAMIVLGGVLIGAVLGEWWRIEDGLLWIGKWLEQHFTKNEQNNDETDSLFIRGFITASLLFCIGPIAILGSIQDGLTGDYSLLAIKSTLDGFASMFFASTLGIGVLFSALPILIYQGGLSLLAVQAQTFLSPSMMNEITATGGVLLLGVSFNSLLKIKSIRLGNFLPSLIISPLIVAILAFFGK